MQIIGYKKRILNNYGDFYIDYKKSGKKCDEYILQYLRNRKSIILNNKEDNHSLRHLEFTRAIHCFWADKIGYLREGLSTFEKTKKTFNCSS